ncbi:hypothetical protein EZJ19_04090 [Parasulfuritortus cantonensis]|uniref:RING-type E3 ubiquitin transferase n=1 Tax=Parasulfuritortus cantonensis TaxID=2528202 RepID=A0A4R1BIV2_9PROT|nr:hypothetical protein [Parasulfuritortus cantonensis]TCJ17137.1 hypothetical protein EZJ19_04090 [Parasulfuritortus cantonensis]
MARLRRYWQDWLSGGGYLMLLVAGLQFQSALAWVGIAATILVLAVLAWLANLRRQRAIADTPTSRIASAAQGYVELVGSGRAYADLPVLSPTHRLPCLWYRYRHFVKDNEDKWRQTEMDESVSPFLLDDGTGLCQIDPSEAEVSAKRKETYLDGDNKVEEELLLAGDPLYAIGEFSSDGAEQVRFDERQELADILNDWKAYPDDLKRRFDLDRDGVIDDREWQRALDEARREMERRRAATLARVVNHRLTRPRFGRPFLVAAFPPEQLAGRYRLRVWLHGLAGMASLVGLAVALQTAV